MLCNIKKHPRFLLRIGGDYSQLILIKTKEEGRANVSSTQEAEQDTGGDGRTDDTGDIGSHGVHEQVVLRIVFQANHLGNTGRIGHSRDPCITDKGIDFVVLFQEKIKKLDKKNT